MALVSIRSADHEACQALTATWIPDVGADKMTTDEAARRRVKDMDTAISPTISEADLGGWERFVHWEQVWGTVVTFDVRGADLGDGVADVVEQAVAFLHEVDGWFSTYRADTPITAIRNGLLSEARSPRIVRDVLAACRVARDLTEGLFDPWAVAGGVDPSGYVKGWAADVAAELLVSRGLANVSVNAAGDVSCRGFQAPGTPWVIGIRHPDHADQVVRTVEVLDGAIATSGRYERGNHILDPRRGVPGVVLESATVIGPDGGLADALATALCIAGPDGISFFQNLPGWSGYLIGDGRASFFGPAFDVRV